MDGLAAAARPAGKLRAAARIRLRRDLDRRLGPAVTTAAALRLRKGSY
jgi:hypothetical protein